MSAMNVHEHHERNEFQASDDEERPHGLPLRQLPCRARHRPAAGARARARALRFARTAGSVGRVGGVVIGFLGVYYMLAARHGLRAFLAWTVATRASVIVVFAVLVATGLGPTVLLLFGAVDLAGAVWTWAALRRDPLEAMSTWGGWNVAGSRVLRTGRFRAPTRRSRLVDDRLRCSSMPTSGYGRPGQCESLPQWQLLRALQSEHRVFPACRLAGGWSVDAVRRLQLHALRMPLPLGQAALLLHAAV